MSQLLKFALIILPSAALTSFIVSLCGYVFPLFITIVIGGVVSVVSFVLLGAVFNIIDVKGLFALVKQKLVPSKNKIARQSGIK